MFCNKPGKCLFCFAKSKPACILYIFAIRAATAVKGRLSLPRSLWFSQGTGLRWYPCGSSWENMISQTFTVFSDSGKTGLNMLNCCVSQHHGMVVFSLCDLLTRPHALAHTLPQHTNLVFFRLAYCDDCMTHCRIPHGFTGRVLGAHQTFFFRHWLTFARHQKHFLPPVY